MCFGAGDPLAKWSVLAKPFPAASLVSAVSPAKGRNAKSGFSCEKQRWLVFSKLSVLAKALVSTEGVADW